MTGQPDEDAGSRTKDDALGEEAGGPEPEGVASVVMSSPLASFYSSHGAPGVERYVSLRRGGGRGVVGRGVVGGGGDGEGKDCRSPPVQASSSLRRFVRLNPRFDADETLRLLEEEIESALGTHDGVEAGVHHPPVAPVTWLDGTVTMPGAGGGRCTRTGTCCTALRFHSIPEAFPLRRSECYRLGRIHGMDVSSGAAVAALFMPMPDTTTTSGARTVRGDDAVEGERDEHVEEGAEAEAGASAAHPSPTVRPSNTTPTTSVLDLCCAPGLKLCAIADVLEVRRRVAAEAESDAEAASEVDDDADGGVRDLVVGVDVSADRINLCRNVLHKYLIDSDTSGYGPSACWRNAVHGEKDEGGGENRAAVGGDGPSADRDIIGGSRRRAMPRVQLFRTDGTTFCGGADDRSVVPPSSPAERSASSILSLHGKDLVFDSTCALEEERGLLERSRGGGGAGAGGGGRNKRRRRNKSARAREQRRLRDLAATGDDQSSATDAAPDDSQRGPRHPPRDVPYGTQFDLVLVDAECSTDGAVRHLARRAVGEDDRGDGVGGSAARVGGVVIENSALTDDAELSELVDLQRGLLLSGFRRLKGGGSLVYSTCSLSRDQNEGVVSWLLRTQEGAYLIPVSFPGATLVDAGADGACGTCGDDSFVRSGSIEGTVRFVPNTGTHSGSDAVEFGGGFFLARIGKRT